MKRAINVGDMRSLSRREPTARERWLAAAWPWALLAAVCINVLARVFT